ncbi:ABC transporter substrate-binding protein [Aquamicrobium sp. LC103]|uniref:ABC transporter substrate-binding protein n=1 Tax=Aquamicrobium sp. LC103 TaxID=1120658 RepID=UPI00063EA1F4|nr:ABC transporter substrate-binding protein [Aquamicrobium sp. LC103]TKT75852.1 polyamine ABC transporter substrate-binding protein [Aquamicrobium sp. LC103]
MRLKLSGMILMAALLAGAAFAPLPAHAAQTELRLGAAAADIGTLDPHYAAGTTDRTLVAWIYGGLVRFAPGTTDPAQIEPDLAESWEGSDDNLVWTFKLRQGVQWHHGYGEVTAEDVVFSLEKSADPTRSAFASDYSAFEKVEAVDPYTVRITLKNVIPSVLGPLANYAGGFIISKKAYEERGEEFARRPVGFGPFQLDSIEAGVAVHFSAHADYFRGAPKLTKVTYRFLNAAAARDLAFVAGEVDAATGLADPRWLQRTLATPGSTVDIFDPAELTVLHINTKKKPFDDIRVRQALAYAMDPNRIAQYRGPEFTRVGGSVIPSNNLGYTEDNGLPAFDAEKAKALLTEAGYPDGLTVKMISSQLPSYESSNQILQAQLEETGFMLELEPVEHATWHQMIRQDLSPLVTYGAARFPVADVYLTQFFHSDSIIGTPTAVTNFSHCDVADEQIEAARVETDPQKQIELWQEAQRLIIEAVCGIPMTETAQVWARKEKLDWGFELKGSMSLGPLVTELTHFTE